MFDDSLYNPLLKATTSLTKFGIIQDIPRGGILSYVPIGAVSLVFFRQEILNCCKEYVISAGIEPATP
jgi:hypothetical protein